MTTSKIAKRAKTMLRGLLTLRSLSAPLLWGGAVGGLLVSCDKDVFDWNSDPFKGQTYSGELAPPISTFLESEESFGEYVRVLRHAGMYDALNQSSAGTSFTAFVPTNEAMADFYHRRGVDSLQQLTPEYMRQFVLYHTVKDSILPDAFVMKKQVTNLNQDILTIDIDSMHAGQASLNGGDGHITEMGLSAYNGKVYVLSRAMTPLVESVYDRLAQATETTIMQQAIDATGWNTRLATIRDTTYNEQHQRVVTQYYYTLLCVDDATFRADGITSLETLRLRLRQDDSQGLTDDSLLRQYVGYHILQNQYTTAELGAMNGSDLTRIWGASAKSQVFTVSLDTLAAEGSDSRLIINKDSRPAHIKLESSDILAKNGYMHYVDDWMPVWEPQQTTVLWDFADYTDIKNLVDADSYQPAEPTSAEKRFGISNAKCFEFELGESGTKNRSYSYIDYVTCKNNLKEANNYDRVVFNIGYMGKVSMHTPTIVRGKYRVELTIIYMTGNNFMRQQTDGNGGLLKIVFDDNEAGATFTAPYTKVPSPLPGVYTSTIIDEIEFPMTEGHTFSFVVLDPAASTNSNFSLQFDCIRFIPIEN